MKMSNLFFCVSAGLFAFVWAWSLFAADPHWVSCFALGFCLFVCAEFLEKTGN